MSSHSSSSRHRKQRFPRLDRRRLYAVQPYWRSSSSEDESTLPEENIPFPVDKRIIPIKKPRRTVQVTPLHIRSPTTPLPNATANEATLSTGRADRRARDEHNEQERNRRRELAIIYELIRCSFSKDDLHFLEPSSRPGSIEKMSYPQVLQVAYHLLRDEHHNLIMFERTLNDIKRIEKELTHAGIPIPERPPLPSISGTYQKVIETVDKILKEDKSARTLDGVYEVTPAERAALGDRELSFLRPVSRREHRKPLIMHGQFARLGSRHTRRSAPPSHASSGSRHSLLINGNRASTWVKSEPKTSSSSSSTSCTYQTSDSEGSYLPENSPQLYAPAPATCKLEDAIAFEVCHPPEADVLLDVDPPLNM